MKNLFNTQDVQSTIARIEQLKPNSTPLWGKMNVSQMMAHCNVAYEFVYDNKHPKPNKIKRFFLKLFVKDIVVGPKPYKKNNPTAPEFKIVEEKDFAMEKKRLIDYINRTLELGENHFHHLENHSFGKLSATEWNTMFSKHLDHHLQQFGV